jgi:protein-tyrosine phosphatase
MLIALKSKLKDIDSKLEARTSKIRTDFDCHILPGLGDGPATMDESIEMAMALDKAGFANVYCTPHRIKRKVEVDNRAISESSTALQKRLNDEHIDLQLLPGSVYCLNEFLLEALRDPLPLGNTRCLVIEVTSESEESIVRETCIRIKGSNIKQSISCARLKKVDTNA